jgi:hypothetical protein
MESSPFAFELATDLLCVVLAAQPADQDVASAAVNSRDSSTNDAGTSSAIFNLCANARGDPLTFNDPMAHRPAPEDNQNWRSVLPANGDNVYPRASAMTTRRMTAARRRPACHSSARLGLTVRGAVAEAWWRRRLPNPRIPAPQEDPPRATRPGERRQEQATIPARRPVLRKRQSRSLPSQPRPTRHHRRPRRRPNQRNRPVVRPAIPKCPEPVRLSGSNSRQDRKHQLVQHRSSTRAETQPEPAAPALVQAAQSVALLSANSSRISLSVAKSGR